MQSKRLSERITEREIQWRKAGAASSHGAGSGELHLLIQSVGRHLTQLLNTRQGSVPQAPDFGMPDLTDLAQSFGGAALAAVEATLARVIERYEPRLRNVTVRYLPGASKPFSVSFAVQGAIIQGETSVPVAYETHIAPDGRITIQG